MTSTVGQDYGLSELRRHVIRVIGRHNALRRQLGRPQPFLSRPAHQCVHGRRCRLGGLNHADLVTDWRLLDGSRCRGRSCGLDRRQCAGQRRLAGPDLGPGSICRNQDERRHHENRGHYYRESLHARDSCRLPLVRLEDQRRHGLTGRYDRLVRLSLVRLRFGVVQFTSFKLNHIAAFGQCQQAQSLDIGRPVAILDLVKRSCIMAAATGIRCRD